MFQSICADILYKQNSNNYSLLPLWEECQMHVGFGNSWSWAGWCLHVQTRQRESLRRRRRRVVQIRWLNANKYAEQKEIEKKKGSAFYAVGWGIVFDINCLIWTVFVSLTGLRASLACVPSLPFNPTIHFTCYITPHIILTPAKPFFNPSFHLYA